MRERRLTPEQVNGGVAHGEGDGLGAGDAGAAARHVFGAHAELPLPFLHQHVLAVAQEGEEAPVERHVVRVARGNAGARAQRASTVPATVPAHTGGGGA